MFERRQSQPVALWFSLNPTIDCSLLFWERETQLWRSKVNGPIRNHIMSRVTTTNCILLKVTLAVAFYYGPVVVYRFSRQSDKWSRFRGPLLKKQESTPVARPAFLKTLPVHTNTVNTTLTPAGLGHMIGINRSTGVNIANCQSSRWEMRLLVKGRRLPSTD